MRKGIVVGSLLVMGTIVALPGVGYAQEATMSGTVTDSTGGVLPGVTVTAINAESGNAFVAVTDEHGDFRLSVRVGNYRITAELAGFTTVNGSVQMLLRQHAVASVQMAPSIVQESVKATGEALLIQATISTLGSNIEPRQMQELPINGRNWMDLTMLAPRNRRNESGGLPMTRHFAPRGMLVGQRRGLFRGDQRRQCRQRPSVGIPAGWRRRYAHADLRVRVRGLTIDGEIFDFALNLETDHEWAGATFAVADPRPQPRRNWWDGVTLFVNRQGATRGPTPPVPGNEGFTFAIWGPWHQGAL